MDLFCDPCDAMGADMVTQAAEAAVRPVVQEITGDVTGMAILSNLNDRKCVRAEVELPTDDGTRFEEATEILSQIRREQSWCTRGRARTIGAIDSCP